MTKVIIILGKTGSGKSTLANVISGTNKFKESGSSVSTTKDIQKEDFKENDVNYTVIDTVGIGDTRLKKEEVLDKIAEAVYLARDGISQILFVAGGRFDQFEMATYNLLRTIIFDDDITNYTTIVRTRFPSFEKESEWQADIKKMLAEGELCGIINSCQGRIIHVNNPPIDIKDENELELNKLDRDISRKKIINHLQDLQKNFLGQEDYKPKKLQELSAEISDYMQAKIESKMKLAKKEEKKRKKFEEEIKKKQEEIELNSEQISEIEDSENESEKSSKRSIKLKLIKTRIKLVSLKKNFKKRRRKTENDQELEYNKRNSGARLRITILENELRDLTETKKLMEEIQEAEGVIRQKVLNHIFNNLNDITQVIGGDIFINSIVSDNDNLLENKLSIDELEKQKEKLEAKLLEKKNNDKSLEQIKDEITQKEQELLNLKKQLLNSKEVIEEWQKKGFNIQQAQEWADVLGSGFNPEDDVGFCAWLRDNKLLMAEEVLKYDIGQLKEEYKLEKTYLFERGEEWELEQRRWSTTAVLGFDMWDGWKADDLEEKLLENQIQILPK